MLFETEYVGTVPNPVSLGQNHPNPFNPMTLIGYSVPERSHVLIEVFDISGRKVAVLADGIREGGSYTVSWNGLDQGGEPVSSGIYLYRLTCGKEVISRKMTLIR